MITGDKKQVLVLAVVAVLALGFLVSQLFPKSVKLAVAPAESNTSEVATPTEEPILKLAVNGNPFSHPKLAPKPPAGEKPRESEGEETNEELLPYDPAAEIAGAILPYPAPKLPRASKGKAEENAGSTRKVKKGPLTLKLTGIVGSGEPLALISVRSAASLAFKKGAQIEGGVRVLEVTSYSAVIRVGNKIIDLDLGEIYK